MADVLTWTIERRLRLAERAELLRKELAGIETDLARLEAAEVVFGQWPRRTPTEAGRRASRSRSASPQGRARAGCGWCRTVSRGRAGGPGLGVPADHGDRGRGGQAGDARDVAMVLGRELTPGKVEPVRGPAAQTRRPRLTEADWIGALPTALNGEEGKGQARFPS
ncbi:hypothetical protein GCM10010431_55580 [Streptomyces kunmingensis]